MPRHTATVTIEGDIPARDLATLRDKIICRALKDFDLHVQHDEGKTILVSWDDSDMAFIEQFRD